MKRFVVAALLVSSCVVASGGSSVVRTEDVFAEPVVRKAVTTSPQVSGPGNTVPWGLDRIDQRTAVNSNRSYSFETNGTGVNIYILDSGVDGDHPDFGSRVVNGWSYRSSTTALTSYKNALIDYAQDPQTGIKPCTYDPENHAIDPATFDAPAQRDLSDFGRTDNDGHGTHVAGIAAGDSVGVAKNATIIPVRTLDSCGNGTLTMIREALTWILNDHDSNERAVLNLSLGFDSQIQEVDNAIIALLNEGIVVTAAAGNSAISACNSTPASTPGTISVASSTILDIESSFTNYGDCVDLFSPGSSIPSTYPYFRGTSDTYVSLSGTSMASPFVAGAVARYLQTLSVVPTSSSTGMQAAWTWLSTNATAGQISYFNANRLSQSPNRLLYAPPGIPAQVSQLSATAADASVTVSWSGNVPGITYTATATPGGATCTTVGGASCSITGLSNGVTYSISVSGANSDGVGPSATTTATPVAPPPVTTAPPPVTTVPPSAPEVASTTSQNKSVLVRWSSVSLVDASYVVTTSPQSIGCVTSSTSCVVPGLKNGVRYTFSIFTSVGFEIQSATPRTVVAIPGFTVRRSTMTRGTRIRLTSFLTTPSRGKKTWRESGPCYISNGRLVAPKRKTTCVLRLTVAKYRSYPKMTTTLKVTVK